MSLSSKTIGEKRSMTPIEFQGCHIYIYIYINRNVKSESLPWIIILMNLKYAGS